MRPHFPDERGDHGGAARLSAAQNRPTRKDRMGVKTSWTSSIISLELRDDEVIELRVDRRLRVFPSPRPEAAGTGRERILLIDRFGDHPTIDRKREVYGALTFSTIARSLQLVCGIDVHCRCAGSRARQRLEPGSMVEILGDRDKPVPHDERVAASQAMQVHVCPA